MIDPVDLLELPVLTSENCHQFDEEYGVRVLFDGMCLVSTGYTRCRECALANHPHCVDACPCGIMWEKYDGST